RDHIESAGHVCVLQDTRDFGSASEVTLLMSQDQEPFDAALAIHLFKGGRLLLDAGMPFGVVFGGTDINEDVKDEHKRSVMKKVLHKARFAVAFTEEMKQKAKTHLDCDTMKIYVQAQGIETRTSSDFSWTDFLHTSGVCVDRVDDLHVFLLVCGLRKVKDPLFLLNAFSEWHAQNPLVILIIIGPKIDPALSSEVKECVKRCSGVFLAAERNQEELHAAMRKAFAVVNSSVSEGMSAAILEEFVLLSKRLLRDKELQENLKSNGKHYVTERHDSATERRTYQQLVEKLQ
ncbi:glycosyltransferase 1 domain-containing protein 1, partial [Silurus asotus]